MEKIIFQYRLSLVLLMSMCLFIACAKKKRNFDCSSLKRGTFIQYSRFLDDTFLIRRYDTIQIEKSKKTGMLLYSKIKWRNACEYDISFLLSSDRKVDSIFKVISRPLSIKILSIESSYYIFKASVLGLNNEVIDTMKIVSGP